VAPFSGQPIYVLVSWRVSGKLTRDGDMYWWHGRSDKWSHVDSFFDTSQVTTCEVSKKESTWDHLSLLPCHQYISQDDVCVSCYMISVFSNWLCAHIVGLLVEYHDDKHDQCNNNRIKTYRKVDKQRNLQRRFDVASWVSVEPMNRLSISQHTLTTAMIKRSNYLNFVFTKRRHANITLCRRHVPVCLSSRCSTETAERKIKQTMPHDSPGTLVSDAEDLGKTQLGPPQWRRRMHVG